MNTEIDSTAHEITRVSFPRLVGYFLWLGTVGFGGPIALAGHMQQDLVDERGWISKEDYLEGLALAQLAPGPLAAQLAIYLGYIRAGVLGATAVGVAFVLPSFLMVLALSAAYVRFGGLQAFLGSRRGIGTQSGRDAGNMEPLDAGEDLRPRDRAGLDLGDGGMLAVVEHVAGPRRRAEFKEIQTDAILLGPLHMLGADAGLAGMIRNQPAQWIVGEPRHPRR